MTVAVMKVSLLKRMETAVQVIQQINSNFWVCMDT